MCSGRGSCTRMPFTSCLEVKQIASAITPVPGGVGPMTIAMLMSNCGTGQKARLSNRHSSNALRMKSIHIFLRTDRLNNLILIAHSKTRDLPQLCRQADLLIVAIGKPQFIGAEYVKEGAVVIDVGIHRDENNKLCLFFFFQTLFRLFSRRFFLFFLQCVPQEIIFQQIVIGELLHRLCEEEPDQVEVYQKLIQIYEERKAYESIRALYEQANQPQTKEYYSLPVLQWAAYTALRTTLARNRPRYNILCIRLGHKIRREIDEIDRQIVSLYEERMQRTTEVAEYKISTGCSAAIAVFFTGILSQFLCSFKKSILCIKACG